MQFVDVTLRYTILQSPILNLPHILSFRLMDEIFHFFSLSEKKRIISFSKKKQFFCCWFFFFLVVVLGLFSTFVSFGQIFLNFFAGKLVLLCCSNLQVRLFALMIRFDFFHFYFIHQRSPYSVFQSTTIVFMDAGLYDWFG